MRSAPANVGHAAGQIAQAVVVAVIVTVISLDAIGRVHWPAYNSSNQLHALTTVGQFGCLLALLAAGWLWRRGRLPGRADTTEAPRRRDRLLARTVALVFLSAFSVVTLAMPLGATKLYLFGISVDQQFRTEYLTRLTDTAAPHDMTYADLPPFYPPGWFWIGGRAAALTGTPAWEMFKPWAITSITVAVAVAFVLWSALIRFEYALIVSAATAAATLAYAPTEPYAAVIAVLLPAIMVLAWSGLRGSTRSGGWAAVVGVGLFLGFAATFYTLLFAYSAFTLALMTLALVASRRQWDPVRRLAVIAVIAAGIALLGWLPYLLAALRGSPAGSATAQHYLPGDGAVLPFPMLQFTLLGALCLLGTLWLVVCARTSTRAGALAISVLAVYAWSLLSMLTTLVGTTLLSFRLQPTLTVLLAAAGAFGFIETASAVAARCQPAVGRRIVTAAGALGLIGALTFSQNIPDVLRTDIIVAYTDTDGAGQRADLRPPGAETYYRQIDAAITKATGRPRDETIVLTADYSFLSYYPYYGFQGLTSHYANPLAQFDARAAAIESWSKLTGPTQFVAALDRLPWKPPTVFLMREGADDHYTLRLASDVYPNQPNVKRYQVALDAALFRGPQFAVSTIGPFVLAVRNPMNAG